MAIYEVVQIGDEILRAKAQEVRRFDERLGKLLDDMADTMYEAEGVGLAAPQIGISKKVVVIDVGEGLIELVNPRILDSKGKQRGEEGCLSLKGKFGIVNRANWVKVEAQDRNGNVFRIEGEEFLARALQHEIDHLDGILYCDLAEEGSVREG
ncbi:MAG: peptide deformylase [Bacillota bacterium]|jgi:peptide deformylase